MTDKEHEKGSIRSSNEDQSNIRNDEYPKLKRYVQIVENHPDMICQWLPDGTLTYANKAYCQYFRKSLKELVGKTCLDYIHPDDQDKLAEHISQFESNGKQEMIELRIVDSQGEVRWHQWVDKYIVDSETQQGEFLSTGRDITDLKLAQFELERRIKFERLVSHLSVNFINFPLADLNNHIDEMLAEIGQFADVDRSYVFLVDEKNHMMSNTHEWCREGIDPQIQKMQKQSLSKYSWWMHQIKNLKTIYISSIEDLPEEAAGIKEVMLDQDIKSMLGVPLVHMGRLLGFIGFDAVRSVKEWTDDEVTLLGIVGGIIGSAIVQKRTQEEINKRKQYLEKLTQLTMASLTTKDLDETLQVIAEQIGELVNADYCAINLWDERKKKVYAVAVSGDGSEEYREYELNFEGESMTKSVLKAGNALIAEDVSRSPYVNKKTLELFPAKSLLGVPLIADGRKLGSALFGYKKKHRFSIEEISIAQQTSAVIAQTILKMYLLEQAKKSAEKAETLHKAGTIVASTLKPEVAIERILEQLGRVVPFDSASVQILREGYLEVRSGKGWPSDQNPVGLRFPVPGNNPNTIVIRSRKPFVLNNTPEAYVQFEELFKSRIQSWMGVPLMVYDRVIGMLTLDHHEPGFYNDQHLIDLATAFADQVAISLENARLYEDEHRRVKELDALRETTADITKELALPNLLRAILQRATSLLDATGGELGLVTDADNEIRILVSHNMGADNVGSIIKMGEGLMGYAAKTRQIQVIEDYQEWDERLPSYRDSKIHAAIAAPLLIGSRLLGVIGVINSDRRRKFSESEKSLMSLFAQQASIAVENAQLFEERRKQARIDVTTGIYNRRGLYELGQRELERAQRYERPLAAIMIDIDHFKEVNDTHGHAIGDVVLKDLVKRLQERLRAIDILGRYGGEEFAILLPETSTESAREVAERLRTGVRSEPFNVGTLEFPITISLGVAVTKGRNCDLHMLLDHADHAMYHSKRSGRNRVSMCEHSL